MRRPRTLLSDLSNGRGFGRCGIRPQIEGFLNNAPRAGPFKEVNRKARKRAALVVSDQQPGSTAWRIGHVCGALDHELRDAGAEHRPAILHSLHTRVAAGDLERDRARGAPDFRRCSENTLAGAVHMRRPDIGVYQGRKALMPEASSIPIILRSVSAPRVSAQSNGTTAAGR
jgi:hypothetical protein